jgi:DNA-binding beta-propeller fold protein YncE
MLSRNSLSTAAVTRVIGAALIALCLLPFAAAEMPGSSASKISTIASTIPSNGDINPYGIFEVPSSTGNLVKGDFLISNFNSSANLQGTGTTLVQISPSGTLSLFAQIDGSTLPGPCTGGVGLTTALAVLRSGWVIVGSLPTTDGMADTAQAGCLLVLDSYGNVAETIYGTLINGPWDLAVLDDSHGSAGHASLFVSNVLNGTVAAGGNVVSEGTVVRVDLQVSSSAPPFVQSMTVIGSGFSERTDPAALVIGPTGLALSASGKSLYVADSLNNRIAVISNPVYRTSSGKTGSTLTEGGALNDPLGVTVSSSGDILSVNGDDGYLVVTTSAGKQISKTLLDNSGNPPGSGALFGLVSVGQSVYYVDDATNTLNLYQ